MARAFKEIKWELAASFVVLLIISAFFFLHQVGTSDFFWQVKTGEIIWQTRSVPTTDIFSFTAYGSPWINHEWLSCVLFYGIYSLGGFALLSWFSFFVGTAIALCIFWPVYKLSKSVSLGLILTFAVLLLGAPRFQQLRPDLFGFLFFSLMLAILVSAGGERKKRLWLLIPIQLLWANMHGSAIIGPFLILIFGHYLFAAGALLATAINPFGLQAFIFPFQHLLKRYSISVGDWSAPTWFSPQSDIAAWGLAILVAESILGVIRNRKKISYRLLALAIIFLPAGFIMMRFVPFAAIAGALFLASITTMTDSRRTKIAALVICIGVVVANFDTGPLGAIRVANGKMDLVYGLPMGVGLNEEDFPVEAVDFVREMGLKGNIFNDMAYGGYMIFRGGSEDRVFIDTRTPVFSEDFFKDYVKALHDKKSFEEIAQKYSINYVLYDARRIKETGELSFLLNNPRWKTIYVSDNAIIFKNL